MKQFYTVNLDAIIFIDKTMPRVAMTHECIFETPEQIINFIKHAKDAIIASLQEEDNSLEIITYSMPENEELMLTCPVGSKLMAELVSKQHNNALIHVYANVKKCFADNVVAANFDNEAVPMFFNMLNFHLEYMI